MLETEYHVMYWDVLESCWRFSIVKEAELQELLKSPRYEVRHYTRKESAV